MGQEKVTGRGSPASRETRKASPLEWEKERGAPRPPEWQKTPGVIVRDREWESSY